MAFSKKKQTQPYLAKCTLTNLRYPTMLKILVDKATLLLGKIDRMQALSVVPLERCAAAATGRINRSPGNGARRAAALSGRCDRRDWQPTFIKRPNEARSRSHADFPSALPRNERKSRWSTRRPNARHAAPDNENRTSLPITVIIITFFLAARARVCFCYRRPPSPVLARLFVLCVAVRGPEPLALGDARNDACLTKGAVRLLRSLTPNTLENSAE